MEERYSKPLLISIHRISSEADEGWEYANSNQIFGMRWKKNEKKQINNNSSHHSRDVKDNIFIYF